MRADFDAIRREAGVPEAMWDRPDRRDLPLVTVDPPGSRDLDQALHLERAGGGYRVSYAIADVGAWIVPGGELDRLAWAKGVTVYAPDRRVPLYPAALSEGAASLLPEQDRPAVLWTVDLDAEGAVRGTSVERALVRSRAQLTYAEVDDDRVPLLREVGELRLALEAARGGVDLDPPQQEVVEQDGRFALRYEARLPAEAWNAQLSLLCGMEAARIMLEHGAGLLRTMPPPRPEDLAAVRRSAATLGTPWPEDAGFGAWLRTLPPGHPMRGQAGRLLRGAGYTATVAGADPADVGHFAVAAPYAHVTAPLRRLADRHATELVLAHVAGSPPPDWVAGALADLPAAMTAGARRAAAVERGVVDHLEALVLAPRVGEVFTAVVTDAGERGVVLQLRDPAVLARMRGEADVGATLDVRLVEADPVARRVRFEPA